MISAEHYFAYSRPLTTYYVAHKINREGLFIADNSFYKNYDVKIELGKRAVGIDKTKQIVYLEDDTVVEYDNLLIASGSIADFPDNVDNDAVRFVSTLRTIDDAEKIIALSKSAKDIVILGAGLVSLQVADALKKNGVTVTFVVGSKQILSKNIDVDCAKIIQKRLEARGLLFLFHREVSAIRTKDSKACVITNRGEELLADLVVVGKGIRPNTELLTNTGIHMSEGVLVDKFMRTNIKNIFAAGDVAEEKNSLTGKTEVNATWPNACIQGQIAGLNMVGYMRRHDVQFRENITTFFGLTIASIGSAKLKGRGAEELRHADPRRYLYRKFLLHGERIIGAVLLGELRDVGVISYCIRNAIDISYCKNVISRKPLDFATVLHTCPSTHRSQITG